jgi:hypothetical protein
VVSKNYSPFNFNGQAAGNHSPNNTVPQPRRLSNTGARTSDFAKFIFVALFKKDKFFSVDSEMRIILKWQGVILAFAQ